MFGLLREYFSYHKYSHEYEDDAPKKIFNVYKKEGGYHLYDLAVFIIITTFIGVFFYVCLTQIDQGELGYMYVIFSILGMSALLY